MTSETKKKSEPVKQDAPKPAQRELFEKYKYHLMAPVFLVALAIAIQFFGLDWLLKQFQMFRYVGF